MFEIKGLTVSIEAKEIIKALSLKIQPGEIHIIMGPNGVGKSSLAKALVGHPHLKTTGSILIDSEDLSKMAADERSRKGLFLAFQNPEEVEGVKVSNFIRKALAARDGKTYNANLDEMVKQHRTLLKASKKLGLEESMLARELNVGFSGGEKKRLEMLQIISLNPKVIILDEIDSGLDVDGIKIIAKAISKLNDGKRCFLIITHYPRILKYIKPNFVHILMDGRIVKSGDAKLAHKIEEGGYNKYVKPQKREK